MNPDEMQETPEQAIAKYTTDFTKLAADGKLDPVIGRDEEIRRTIQVLSRRTKNNPVLIGNPGVGKTAIVEGLARRIVSGDVPENLLKKKLLSLDMGAAVITLNDSQMMMTDSAFLMFLSSSLCCKREQR